MDKISLLDYINNSSGRDNILRARTCKLTVDLMSICPQTKVKDYLASVGMMWG